MMSQKSTFFGTARPGSVFIYSPDEMTKAPNPVIKTLDAILGAVWPEKMNNHVWKSLSYPGPEEMPDRLLGNMWSIINTDTEYSKFIIFNMAEWTFDSKDIQPFLNIRVVSQYLLCFPISHRRCRTFPHSTLDYLNLLSTVSRRYGEWNVMQFSRLNLI